MELKKVHVSVFNKVFALKKAVQDEGKKMDYFLEQMSDKWKLNFMRDFSKWNNILSREYIHEFKQILAQDSIYVGLLKNPIEEEDGNISFNFLFGQIGVREDYSLTVKTSSPIDTVAMAYYAADILEKGLADEQQ